MKILANLAGFVIICLPFLCGLFLWVLGSSQFLVGCSPCIWICFGCSLSLNLFSKYSVLSFSIYFLIILPNWFTSLLRILKFVFATSSNRAFLFRMISFVLSEMNGEKFFLIWTVSLEHIRLKLIGILLLHQYYWTPWLPG